MFDECWWHRHDCNSETVGERNVFWGINFNKKITFNARQENIWELCFCQTVILKRRILSYTSLPQEKWSFYSLINFDGRLDFCKQHSLPTVCLWSFLSTSVRLYIRRFMLPAVLHIWNPNIKQEPVSSLLLPMLLVKSFTSWFWPFDQLKEP